MAEQDPVERARQVEHVFKNPIFQETLENTLGDLFRQWLETGAGDVTEREWLFAQSMALNAFIARFEEEIAPLQRFNAEREIEAEEKARERASEGD